jgi:hypothetical protein
MESKIYNIRKLMHLNSLAYFGENFLGYFENGGVYILSLEPCMVCNQQVHHVHVSFAGSAQNQGDSFVIFNEPWKFIPENQLCAPQLPSGNRLNEPLPVAFAELEACVRPGKWLGAFYSYLKSAFGPAGNKLELFEIHNYTGK